MNKKKGLFLSVALSVIVLKILPCVTAAFNMYDLSRGPRDLIQIIGNFFSPFFEFLLNTSSYDDFFFAKVLLLILLFVVISFVLKKGKFFGSDTEKGYYFIIYVISAVVSILAMRYLPNNDLIKGILLPYSALGIAITTFLPLLIYFFFVHNTTTSGFGRRAGWILYGIVFIALWSSREIQLSSTSNWIYWSAIIFLIICLIFDKSLHKYFAFAEIRKIERSLSNAQIVSLIEKYHQAKKVYNETGSTVARDQMKFYKRRLKEEGAGVD
jgi:hypothetical protein